MKNSNEKQRLEKKTQNIFKKRKKKTILYEQIKRRKNITHTKKSN